MSILNYFSKDPDKRARFIFNFIAPLYGMLTKHIQKGYVYLTDELDDKIHLKGKSVLDIGTGTGAWIASLQEKGCINLHGIDFSEKMLKQANKKYSNIKFLVANGETLSQFKDNSFDIVTASLVLHGVKKNKREKLLSEMKRISNKYVILNDFTGRTSLFVELLEFLERSDYKNFIKVFDSELKQIFNKSYKIPYKYGIGLYIAEK